MMMSVKFKLCRGRIFDYDEVFRQMSSRFLFLHRFRGLLHNLVTTVLRIWNIHADCTIIKSTDENRPRFSKSYKGKIGCWYSSFTKANFQSWRNLVKPLPINWEVTETNDKALSNVQKESYTFISFKPKEMCTDVAELWAAERQILTKDRGNSRQDVRLHVKSQWLDRWFSWLMCISWFSIKAKKIISQETG